LVQDLILHILHRHLLVLVLQFFKLFSLLLELILLLCLLLLLFLVELSPLVVARSEQRYQEDQLWD
jgi:hypothetical protein